MPALSISGATTALCDFVSAVSGGAPVRVGQSDQIAPASPHLNVQVIDNTPIGFVDYVVDTDVGTQAMYAVYQSRYQVDAYGDGAEGVLTRLKMFAESPSTAGAALVAAGLSWVSSGAIRNNTGAFLSGNLPRSTVTVTVQHLQSTTTTTDCNEAASIDVNIYGENATTVAIEPAISIPEA